MGAPSGQRGAPEADTKTLPAQSSWLLKFGELERVGCFLPWEKGEKKEDRVSCGPLLREESDGVVIRSSWVEEACVSSRTR